jgi:hypothetical protein
MIRVVVITAIDDRGLEAELNDLFGDIVSVQWLRGFPNTPIHDYQYRVIYKERTDG